MLRWVAGPGAPAIMFDAGHFNILNIVCEENPFMGRGGVFSLLFVCFDVNSDTAGRELRLLRSTCVHVVVNEAFMNSTERGGVEG